MNCLFIYNPNSGKGKVKKKYDFILGELRKKFDSVEVYESTGPKQITSVAYDACGKYDYLVFSGGDGTFNEVLQGISKAEVKPTLGYIPSGTVNDIARTFKIKRNIKGAVKNILEGEEKAVDCMKINGEYAMYVCGAGLFTKSSYETDQKNKRAMGKIAYFVNGALKELKYEHFDVNIETDGYSLNTTAILLLFINSKSIAGMPINKDAVLDDGIIDCVVVKHERKKGFFRWLGGLFIVAGYFLIRKKYHNKNLIRLKGNHFKITTPDNVIWNFDGEKGNSGSIDVSIMHKSIKIIVPKTKEKK